MLAFKPLFLHLCFILGAEWSH